MDERPEQPIEETAPPEQPQPRPPRKRGWRKNRSKGQIEADMVILAEMYCQGYKQSEIGEVLGISQQHVCEDIKKLREAWRDSGIRNFDLAKEEELRKLDAMEREAWDAFRRSRRPMTTRSQEETKKPGGGDGDRKLKIEQRETVGDPRYMLIVLDCIDKRCKLLALYPPQKIAPTDPTGMEPYLAAGRQMSDDELRVMAAMDRHIQALQVPSEN
jgi:hypothetical protein